MDLVSVVITTYGRTDTLHRAIKSVLSQTYPNIEIIVVDDNKDEQIRKEVIKTASSIDDSRVKLVMNAVNMGGALARNEGIKAAKGKYIAFLDDDDEYLPLRVEKQVEVFEKDKTQKLALVYCYCVQKKNGSIIKKYHYDYVGNCIYPAMLDCVAATSQWMCKKDALENVGMFTDTPCKQDSFLMLKLLVNGYTIDRVPEYLSVYNTDSNIRISTGSHEKRIVGEEKLRELCRANYDMIENKQRNVVEYSFACRLIEHYYALGKKQKVIECLKLLIKHPFRRKTVAAYKHIIHLMSNQRVH